MSKRIGVTLGGAGLLLFCALGSAQAASLTARGNEPSWRVDISDERIAFSMLDGETVTLEPAPAPTVSNGISVYSATTDQGAFALVVADKVCIDTMSGMPHPKTAIVISGERKLVGCGGDPADLLRGEWRVEEIGGKAIIAGSEPSLAFEADGSIHGNGSCNRFFGTFTLTGEGLTVSQVGATMMACDQGLMDQEHRLLQAFETVGRFDVGDDGGVRLVGHDGRVLVKLGK
ncbi:META domain-containing protein [Devosia sp. D6-9]|nr:META domain-containing protein [Devosia sp. D6-9]